MITVSKEINLSQLDAELNGKGLIASVDENKKVTAVGLADGNDATEAQLQVKIDAHLAQPTPELTIEEKLASVGLSLDELKAALA
jgi:hypothetical protein